MFTSIKNFLSRHKKKLLVAGAVVGGAVLLGKYAQGKLIDWQEKEAKEFLERTRRLHLFQSTERTCNQTIVSLAVQLKKQVETLANTEDVLEAIRTADESLDQVRKLWEELEVKTFTRHSLLLYSGVMLVLLERIQLNIIGGYMCQDHDISNKLKEKYMCLGQYFIEKGVKELACFLEGHVREVLKEYPLTCQLGLKEIEHIFWQIQARVAEDPVDPVEQLSKYLLPPLDSSDWKGDPGEAKLMDSLVKATIDVLNEDQVSSLMRACLSHGYSNSVDLIADHYKLQDSGPGPKNGSRLTLATKPMAKLIPILHGLGKPDPRSDVEPWIHQFILMDRLKQLGAHLFEKYAVAP